MNTSLPKRPDNISFDYPRYHAIALAHHKALNPEPIVSCDATAKSYVEGVSYQAGDIVLIKGQAFRIAEDYTADGAFNPNDWREVVSNQDILGELERPFKGLATLTEAKQSVKSLVNVKEVTLELYIMALAKFEVVLGHSSDELLTRLLTVGLFWRGTNIFNDSPSNGFPDWSECLHLSSIKPINKESVDLYGQLIKGALPELVCPSELDYRIVDEDTRRALDEIKDQLEYGLYALEKITEGNEAILSGYRELNLIK